MQKSLLVGGHEHGVDARHVVYWHCNVDVSDTIELIGLRPGPKLDFAVPSPRDDQARIIARHQQADDILDRPRMFPNGQKLI